jgi:hypothetical protein
LDPKPFIIQLGLKVSKLISHFLSPFPLSTHFFVAQKRSKKVADREMKLELFAM